jgi:hypothetical protein
MKRSLTVLFRRDPSRDRQRDKIHFEGYQVLWPDGQEVTVGLDALCKHGQRLLGLGKHLAGCSERLIELIFYPLRGREDHLTRIPGHRVRRFCLKREGRRGRVHFLDGTPTETVFEMDRDEARVLEWTGLPDLSEGEHQWFDLAARAVEATPATHGLPMSAGHAFRARAASGS